MTEKKQCSEMVSGEGQWGAFYQHKCRVPAIVERDGKWYCGIHDPERKKARRIKEEEQWQGRQKARREEYARTQAVEDATFGLTLAELKSLTPTKLRACDRMAEVLRTLQKSMPVIEHRLRWGEVADDELLIIASLRQAVLNSNMLLKEIEESTHEA